MRAERVKSVASARRIVRTRTRVGVLYSQTHISLISEEHSIQEARERYILFPFCIGRQ